MDIAGEKTSLLGCRIYVDDEYLMYGIGVLEDTRRRRTLCRKGYNEEMLSHTVSGSSDYLYLEVVYHSYDTLPSSRTCTILWMRLLHFPKGNMLCFPIALLTTFSIGDPRLSLGLLSL